MSEYFPKDINYFNEARRVRIRREKEGLEEILALLDAEEKARAEKAQWQIRNEEMLQQTLDAIRKLYYEKRLAAIQEYAEKIVTEEKKLASEQAEVLEEYFNLTGVSQRFSEAVKRAFAFSKLSAELKSQISEADLTIDLSQIKKIKVENVESAVDKIQKQIGKELTAYKEFLEEFGWLGQQIGESFAEGVMQGGDSMHKALKEILSDTVRFLERFIIAARLKSAVENFFLLGPIGLLKAAGESALITVLLETAKNEILSFASGGVIEEPVVGVGTKSQKRYVLGEEGPEVVSPVSPHPFIPTTAKQHSGQTPTTTGAGEGEQMLQELRGLRRDIASLELRVRGEDLVMAMERGRRIREGKRV